MSTSPSSTPGVTSVAASTSESLAELRLIPEFGGLPTESVGEWLEKVDLICSLRGLCKPEAVIPLRLTGGAFAVYQQLSIADKADVKKVKAALVTSFGTDPFAAYEQFTSRKLLPYESVDVYLAQLRQIASQFGGVSDKTLTCAFVAGLPDSVRQALRASSRMESLSLVEILARARAVMVDHCVPIAAAQVATSVRGVSSPQLCYECHQPNHVARDCLLRRRGAGSDLRSKGGRRRCFKCDSPHHLASTCPGNDGGEKPNAPASSPNLQ